MFGPPEDNPYLHNPEFNKEEYEQNLLVEAQLRKYEEEALKNTDLLCLGCPETARVRLYNQVQKTQQAKAKGGSGGGGMFLPATSLQCDRGREKGSECCQTERGNLN